MENKTPEEILKETYARLKRQSKRALKKSGLVTFSVDPKYIERLLNSKVEE